MSHSFERIACDKGIQIYHLKKNKETPFAVNFYILDTLEDSYIITVLVIMMVIKKYKKVNRIAFDERLKNITYLNAAVTRKGEYQVVELYIEGLVDNAKECIELMEYILNEPIIDPGSVFSEQRAREEIESLKAFVNSKPNNLTHYAMSRFHEEMFKGERFSIGEYTDIHSLDTVTSESLLTCYRNMLKNLPIRIILTGELDNTSKYNIQQWAANYTRGEVKALADWDYEVHPEENTIIESLERIDNERVVMGFRTDVNIQSDSYYAMLVLNSLLGGGTYSRLFKKLREEKFLTYEAFSLYDEFKGYLMISSSCLPGNSVLVKDLIQEEISQISKGQFSHMEFAEALDQLETYYQTCEDDHHRWVDFYLRQILSNKEMNVPEFIERLKSVDIIQVVEAASSLRMDTLYILKAEK